MSSTSASPPEPEPTRGDYQRLAAFRFALRRFASFSAEAARSVGLAAQQHQALLAIKGCEGPLMTVGALADQLLVAPHSAAELVARLCVADLVEKIADPADRRRVGLILTAHAERTLRELSLVHLREIRELAPRLIAILAELQESA